MSRGIPRGTLEDLLLKHHLLIVLDCAPSHRSEQIAHPENVSLIMLPPYSPELDPAERWFEEFRRKLSNRTFEIRRSTTRGAHPDATALLGRPCPPLKRLTGYSWWVEAVEAL
jgi:transposase